MSPFITKNIFYQNGDVLVNYGSLISEWSMHVPGKNKCSVRDSSR